MSHTTGGKGSTGVVDTRGKFTTTISDPDGLSPLMLLTPVVRLELQISPWIFEKI
jgi:hypothetical protein